MIYFFESGLQKRLTLDHLSRTTWVRDGTERLRFCSEIPTTMLPLTYSRWVASWLNSLRWDLCFPVRASKTKWCRYARCSAHRPAWTGPMDSNLLSSLGTSSPTTCHRTSIWWFRMQAMKQSNSYQTCFNTTRLNDLRPLNASSIPSFEFECRYQSVHRKTNRALKRSSTSSWAVAACCNSSKTIKTLRCQPKCQKWRYNTLRSSVRRS